MFFVRIALKLCVLVLIKQVMYSFMHLYLYGFRDVSFILWIITQCSINYFLSELF